MREYIGERHVFLLFSKVSKENFSVLKYLKSMQKQIVTEPAVTISLTETGLRYILSGAGDTHDQFASKNRMLSKNCCN